MHATHQRRPGVRGSVAGFGAKRPRASNPATGTASGARLHHNFSDVSVLDEAPRLARNAAPQSTTGGSPGRPGFAGNEVAVSHTAAGHLDPDVSLVSPMTSPEERIEVVPRNCGPNSSDWLVDQMNTNRNHPAIQTSREVQWPNYVPFFNIGWNIGFLRDFRALVRAGGPWDFKSNQMMWRAGPGRTCPTQACNRTVTLCGRCYNYDVPGNIHYGWIGRQAGLRAWFLHNRADAAQAGGTDDPRDAVAIDIGIAMADDGASLCGELGRRGDELNRAGTTGCSICGNP